MRNLEVIPPRVLKFAPVVLLGGMLHAQVNLQVGASDQVNAASHTSYKVHTLPTSTPQTNRFSPLATAGVPQGLPHSGAADIASSAGSAENSSIATDAGSTIASVPAPGFYPADLSYMGGPVLTTSQSVPLYVDCTASCWNDPAKFLNHLFASNFIHITDQYVGSTANNRYTVSSGAQISYPIFTTLDDNDILSIAYAAGKKFGTGYGNLYHIFLPKGVDVCFAGTSICYSPDNLSTFSFCAYHGSVTFSDIGHVLFSVEPYQDVTGCSEVKTANFTLTDSTANSLSHETIEAITDPDLNAWFSFISIGTIDEEIGDLCTRINPNGPGFFNPPTNLAGKNYSIQPEYSNKYHACAYAP